MIPLTANPRPRRLDYAWISSALLLLYLSVLPFLLPMADSIPKPVVPSDSAAPARAHNRLVVMIVDGLGYRRAVDPALMPHLQARMRASAFGMALASFPTITPSGLRAIMAGHRTASEPQAPTGIKTSSEIDSVLMRATKAGLKCFVVGQFSWNPLFPAGHGALVTEIPYEGMSLRYDHGKIQDMSSYDERVLQAADPVISGKRGPWDLLVVHLFESDTIGHSLGTAGGFYSLHLRWLDQKIEAFSRKVEEDQPTTFLLVADHGQADDGSHGGLSNVERQAPFVLWGAGVKPEKLGSFPLYDVAPTISAILGIPPPALSEGWPKFQALELTPKQKTNVLKDLLQQRLGRWRAVKESFPWLHGDPMERTVEIERAYRDGKYDIASAILERSIHAMDRVMEEALPAKWLWRLIAALWALALAAMFALAWNQAEIKAIKVAAFLSGSCFLLSLFPLLRPSQWSLASTLILVSSIGILLLSLAHGIKMEGGLDRLEWGLWWLGFCGIAFQEIVDIYLWSWIVLIGLFISRFVRLTRQNAVSTIVSLTAVLVCLTLVLGTPSTETSLLRSFLPDTGWRGMTSMPWNGILGGLFLAWLIGSYFPLVRFNEDPRRWTLYGLISAPAITAILSMQFKPSAAILSWLVSGISLVALIRLQPSPSVRGMWLSAIALAYYRTLSDQRQWCILTLAVIVGWTLAWRSRDAHPLWEGLGLLGIGLWSYSLSGSHLSFSNITVSEGYQVLGEQWHPYVLLAVLALKPLAAISAPILPRLSIRPLYSFLGIYPLLGALCAGNLTSLWLSRFMSSNAQKFTDSARFAQTEFVLVLSWLILGLWAATRLADPALWRRLAFRRS